VKHNSPIKRALLIGLLAVWSPALADSYTEAVDKSFSQWARPDSPGCSVGVFRNGSIIYKHSYGMADLEREVPLTPSSVFYLASVSKQFTAASIVLLLERGKVKLSDPVRKYIPELPAYADPVTIDHLIHHTSGIRDFLTLMSLAHGGLDDLHISDEEFLQLLARQKSLNFQPGEAHLYSNSGYVLLSIVVRRISGKSLREFAQENLFTPLGMKNTHYHDDHTEIVKNRAVGYTPRKGGGYSIDSATLDVVGDGGLFSTVEDLSLWDRNFYTSQVGGPSFVKTLLSPGRLNNGTNLNYAFGLDLDAWRGLNFVEHSGSLRGYATDFIRFPEHQLSIVCLCNTSAARPGILVREIAAVYLGDKMTASPSPPSPVPPKRELTPAGVNMTQYAGDYYSEELPATFRLTVEGDGLKLVRANGKNQVLSPTGPDSFTIGAATKLMFSRDGAEITGFVLTQGRASGLIFTRVRH
jgi:CubicO group peptidase (beta-lactamase class C family)